MFKFISVNKCRTNNHSHKSQKSLILPSVKAKIQIQTSD